MKLSERVRLARKHAGLTQKELADIVGIAQTAISQLESGKTQRSTYLIQIAMACKVNTEWLASGEGSMLAEEPITEDFIRRLVEAGRGEQMDITADEVIGLQTPQPIRVWDDETPLDDDEVEVPFLREVELSAGSGRTVIEQSTTAKLRFGKRSLRTHNVQFDQAVCVVVSGNSMEPVLPNGSTVGINTGQISVIDGKMYALKHDGQLRVKVLYRLPGGGIRLRSLNNAEHPDESYTADEMVENSIEIIGRVFWGASFF